MDLIINTILVILVLSIIYLLYQIVRNKKVSKIRSKWIYNDDYRWHKYEYEDMLNPSFSNWLGIKYPNDKQFD